MQLHLYFIAEIDPNAVEDQPLLNATIEERVALLEIQVRIRVYRGMRKRLDTRKLQ